MQTSHVELPGGTSSVTHTFQTVLPKLLVENETTAFSPDAIAERRRQLPDEVGEALWPKTAALTMTRQC